MTKYLPEVKHKWLIAIILGIIIGNVSGENLSTTEDSLKTSPSKALSVSNSTQQVLRLRVSNGTNSDETVILFNANAQDGYDNYDSPKMSNGNVAIPEIYTVAGGEQLVINGLNSITTNEVVPLGFYTGQSNTFTIRATQVSNFNSNTKIVLKDNVLVKEYDLTSGNPYTFTSGVYSSTNRFSIIFKAKIFRSKASGNWNDVNTWESSYDNSLWNAASTIPTSNASSITISNGNLVTLTENATAYTLNINPEGKLTLNSGKTLNDTTLNIQSDNTGTGTLVDLNLSGGLTVTSTTSVNQYLTSGRNWYISSPVTGASTSALSTASSVQSYNEQTATWTTESGLLATMKGYVAVSPSSSGAITFAGALNTGTQSIGLTRHPGVAKEGFNLVGNPYPSYVNWESALNNSGTTFIKPTMWFRSKNAGNTAYIFDTYNALAHAGTSNNNNSAIGVTADIPPMQAFWVKVDDTQTSGTLTFDNSMRSHQDQSISTNRLKSPANPGQPILRLQVSNGLNGDEAIVLFNPNASDKFDDYDSQKMTNANADIPEIYTTAANEHLAINSLNNLSTNHQLPLGFSTGKANTFTLTAKGIHNFEANTKVILRDNLLDTEQDLTTDTAYTFTSDATSTDTRFSLIFKSNSDVTALNSLNEVIKIHQNDPHQITISCNTGNDNEGVVSIYDQLGRRIITRKISTNMLKINMPSVSGVYFITAAIGGKSVVKKIAL
jgi:hypothetical protein